MSTTPPRRGTPRHATADLQIGLPFDASATEPVPAAEAPVSSVSSVTPGGPNSATEPVEPSAVGGHGVTSQPGTGLVQIGGASTDGDDAEPGPPAPAVHFVKHPRARRYVLRVHPDGSVRVTIPRRGSRREGEAFLQRSGPWVERQRARLAAAPGRRQLSHGDTVLVAGVPMPLVVEAEGHHVVIGLGEIRHRAKATADTRAVVALALRSEAHHVLPARLLELARAVGLKVGRVSIRDQKGRWGSCAASGNISLNWRLVQMPPEVRDYVLLHELMHLREQNHSRRFWKHLADACPWHLQARRWLAREGRALL